MVTRNGLALRRQGRSARALLGAGPALTGIGRALRAAPHPGSSVGELTAGLVVTGVGAGLERGRG
ncbi:hypothetical protein ACIRRH_10250 [Kitasatospora sp. NPDC101235]|uniref:hypothetical protein n=1 Tax=Kitasatospora sp. NPDC101235 TaxID=3364101 RepID=UPI0037F5FF7A